MRLAHPQLLWLLLAVPAAIVAYVWSFSRRRRQLAALGDHPLIVRMAGSVSPRRKIWRAILFVSALFLIAFTLARPQAGGKARLSRQRGLDLVVALDFSKSMLAKDVYPSRLERAKHELENLMDRLAGDRIGLVAFAGEPLTYPPTTDYAALKLFWRDLSPWDMPVGGTAVGRALRASLDLLVRLRSQEAASHDGRGQAILLLTDGEDNESEPLEVAEAASKLGIKVFTVGIGSRSGELIPQYDENGAGAVVGYLKDESGKYVTSKLAEDMLIQIASKTGGEYIHADPKQFGVERITQALTGMKRTENEARLIKEYDEIADLLLFPAFLLLVGEAVTHERRKGAVSAAEDVVGPKPTTPASRNARSPASSAVVALLLVGWPLLAGFDVLRSRNHDAEEGNKLLSAGKAEDALAAFDKATGKLGGDPALRFDRGAALFALSRFDEAGEDFLRATEAKDPGLKEAAFYNLGNALFKKDKFKEAIEAYRRALSLDPRDQNAKWNLELALKKKQEDDKKKQDQKKDDKNKDDKNKDQNKDKDQSKNDKNKDQDKDKGKQPPKPEETPADQQQMEAILDSLDKSPKSLEQERARLRAVRRAPPSKDW